MNVKYKIRISKLRCSGVQLGTGKQHKYNSSTQPHKNEHLTPKTGKDMETSDSFTASSTNVCTELKKTLVGKCM